jgi:hypothetical protein
VDRRLGVFVAVVLCCATLSVAQTPTAVVNGQVRDISGAAIPNAAVVVINDATGIRTTTETNAEGIYSVPNLQPGTYRIQVSKQGFKTIVHPDIVLHVQDAEAIGFTLPVGPTSDTVTVEGGAPLVNTENAAVSTVIDRNFVESLPLNGRSFNTLLQLTPGVVIASAPLGAVSSPGQFSISGQRTNANSFSVDGVSANFGVVATANPGSSGTGSQQALNALGGTSSLVSVEALQEFRVETSSFSPEFGRSPGGQVILTTRSGTSDFHGGVYEYFRNDVLDANDWFANSKGKPRAPERHNDFGGFLGGPIWKNKTFFFFSYEGARLRIPQAGLAQVPSAYARSSAPSVSPLVNAFPQPDDSTVTPGVYTSQFTSSFSNSATLNATSIRIDQTLSDHFSIFGRYNYAPSQTVNRPGLINVLEPATANTQTLTIGANMVLGKGIANTVRGNFSTQTAGTSYSLDSFGGAAPFSPSLLLGSLPVSSSFTTLTFDDLSAGLQIGLNARNRARQVNFVDDVAIASGSHQVKFGGDYRAIFFDRAPDQAGALYEVPTVQQFVSPGTAGVIPATFFNTQTSIPAQVLAQSLSLYGQDTWKITPRLTLTYGLRWELSPAPSGRGSTDLASWTNTNNPSQIALAPRGTSLWSTVYSNFAPRVGVAYSVSSRGDFILRAGFGVFYDNAAGFVGGVAAAYPNSAFGFPPNAVTLPIADVTPFLPTISLQPPYPFASGFNNDLTTPRSYQWNVALEKSFGGKQAISATYVGQGGRDQLRYEGLPQPNANFQNFLTLETNGAYSNYDALQLQYRRPLSARVQALLNYTWSHSLDNVSDDSEEEASHTVISGARDYANSSFDVRHSFSGAINFLVPEAGRSGFLSATTRGWSLSSVIVARTGFPFNATAIAGGPGGIGLRRPNLVAGQPLWVSNPAVAGGQSLNPKAFMYPPFGQQGTEPRNDIPGFGLTQADLSVGRKFTLSERINLQFRADAFNALNHPNFANPNALIFPFGSLLPFEAKASQMLNSGLGGLNPLFQEGGPRSLQLSLKLTF